MGALPECRVLRGILAEPPACQGSCRAAETPSYVEGNGKVGVGCLVAHSTLTLIEAQWMAPYFKAPLYRLFAASAVRGLDYTQEQLWDLLLTVLILHDIGKLTDQYVGREASHAPVLHHEVSAVVVKRSLGEVVQDYLASTSSYAVLLHHEAIDWRAIERDLIPVTYLHKVLSTTKPLHYTVSQGRAKAFEANTLKVLGQALGKGLISKDQHRVLTRSLAQAVDKLIGGQGCYLKIHKELGVLKFRDTRYLAPALALYRLLYLADNRAASARSRYWAEQMRKVDWTNLEDVAQQVIRVLTKRRYYIGLSALPEALPEVRIDVGPKPW